MKGISDAVLEKWGYDPGWSSEVEFNMKMLIEKYVNLEYFHIYRMLWRSQTCAADRQPLELSCPESCSLDTPTSECRCTCKGIDPVSGNTDDFDWENVEPCLYCECAPPASAAREPWLIPASDPSFRHVSGHLQDRGARDPPEGHCDHVLLGGGARGQHARLGVTE